VTVKAKENNSCSVKAVNSKRKGNNKFPTVEKELYRKEHLNGNEENNSSSNLNARKSRDGRKEELKFLILHNSLTASRNHKWIASLNSK
jgi:hypothetical protein